MRLHSTRAPCALLIFAACANAVSRWSFTDGSVAISGGAKGAEGQKDKLSVDHPLAKELVLGASSTLRVQLTVEDSGSPKQPDQAFLLLRDPDSRLETNFPLTVKSNGKARVDVAHKDLPLQLLLAEAPLEAAIVLASTGSSVGLQSKLFDVAVQRDASVPAPQYETPLRYGRRAEIHHTFRADPRSPPRIVSAFFVLAVLATLPVLIGAWLYLGANLDHLNDAVKMAPVSHALYFGSILAMEGVFLLYYTSWNLFRVLPVAAVISVLTVLSGSKALSEVQGRRLAGLR